MSRVFFLSYATPDKDDQAHRDALDRFWRDLASAVAALVTLQPGGDFSSVGYRYSVDLEPGTPDWKLALATSIAEYPVGIVLRSAQYLAPDRPWCRWECLTLAERNDWADTRLGSKPRMLLVLNWSPVQSSDVPKEFPDAQMVQAAVASNDADDQRAVEAVFHRGLRQTIDLAEGDKQEQNAYKRFVATLAAYTVKQWREWTDEIDKRQLDVPLPDVFQSELRWTAPSTNAGEPGQPRQLPRRKVVVVYVAAEPAKVAALSPNRTWRYDDDGEADWQPFSSTPNEHPKVEAMVRSLKDIEVERWHFDYFSHQMAALLAKVGQRYPVLFIVDPWTTSQIAEYRQALEAYARLDPDRLACTIPVVIWNDADPDLAGIRADFEARVDCLFDRYRWETVESVDDFSRTLTAAIRKLQSMIRKLLGGSSLHGGSPAIRISPSPKS